MEAVFTRACFSLTANVSHGTLYLVQGFVEIHFDAASTCASTKFSYSSFGVPFSVFSCSISNLFLNSNTYLSLVRSPDGDTEYFDIVAGVRQGHTLASYFFIICLDYVLRTSIDKIRENGFELTKKRSKSYPTKTITDADNTDDIALLTNTPNQAETLLHSLERATAGIGLHVNAPKTEYMCYNQTGEIDGTSLKLVDKFPYLGSSVSSTEKDIDTRLTKAWTAINRPSIIWKSDLSDKMKCSFFQAADISILLYGCTTWTLTKRLKKKAKQQLHKNAAKAKAGRPARTYIQQLFEDTGCSLEDLPEAMNDREKWRDIVRGYPCLRYDMMMMMMMLCGLWFLCLSDSYVKIMLGSTWLSFCTI